ncbi:uncharacterized protein LOC142166297 [Nicotiana tabacum]|uniref:Uncharacterized protein LOC142166297 n=1 Tax=Nicotiana tabacum TaxID=4097 RepID=A0AC58S8D3_TOBAC
MPAYAEFLKEILSSKRKLEETTMVKLNAHCSSILQNKISQKCGDLGSFTIPCSLESEKFDKALCDYGASINIMPLFVFRKLEDELGVEKFVFPIDFIVVDMKVNMEMKMMMKYPNDEASAYSCFKLDVVGELAKKYKFDKLVGDTLERCITQSNTVKDEDPEIKKEAETLKTKDQVINEEELKEEASKPSVELKVLPTHLKYAFLETSNFPVIISAYLTGTQKQKLVSC